MSLRGCLWCGLLTLGLTSGSHSEEAATPGARPPPGELGGSAQTEARMRAREQLALVDEKRWKTELYLEQIEPALESLFASLEEPQLSERGLRALLHSGFRGSRFSASKTRVQERSGLSHARWRVEPEPSLNRSEFEAELIRYAQGFSRVEHTESHVSLIEMLSPGASDGLRARLVVDFRVAGVEEDALREDQGTLWAEYGRPPGAAAWLLERVSLRQLETTHGSPQFTDISERVPGSAASPDETLFVAYFAEGISLADFDGDGDLDLFAPSRHGAAALYRNDAASFVDVTRRVGLPPLRGVRSGYFFDWDNDGDLDLLVLTRKRIYLFQNGGRVFADVSARSQFDWLSTDGLTGAAVADYDGDGLLDFYVANYGDPANGPGFGYFDSTSGFFNKLFHNEGEGIFSDATAGSGFDRDNQRWSYSALWIDHDEDGAIDLYVINDYGPNQLFRNLGDGSFVDVAAEAGVTDLGNGMGASWADYDNDGKLDLYVSNMHSYSGSRVTNAPGLPGGDEVRTRARRYAKGNTLLRNTGGGRFVEVASTPVTRAGWAWGNVAFDYDNDGDQDLYVVNGMFSNVGEGDT